MDSKQQYRVDSVIDVDIDRFAIEGTVETINTIE